MLNRLMNGEPVIPFLFKGAISAFIGMALASTFDFGGKAYRAFTSAPKCKAKFLSSDSIGTQYQWTIELKNRDSGFFTVYPQDDVLILLDSIKRSDRIIDVDLIKPTFDQKKSKGAIFIFKDGKNDVKLEFVSYSKSLLSVRNTEEAGCAELLMGI